ncbi:MAG: dihydrolipoyl dehydrogenase [Candidatus Stahlbacteria bacterium]|nr:dihydrolipoyl dehydrogenase [Candidatus Stahlbacteria bacterium]
MYDIAIIGSGPAGYVAGIRGSQLGKKVCVIEKGDIGGICLNRGCIPTKSVLASIDSLRNIATANRFGINVGTPEIDFSKVMSRKKSVVKKLTSGVSYLLKQNGVDVLKGDASIKETGVIKIGVQEVKAKSILICTGSSPLVPFTIDHDKVLNSDEALDMGSLPSSILIIGGGAVGIEMATIFCGLGVKVTLVEMMTSILPEIKDNKIIDIIRSSLISKGVSIIEGSKVSEIEISKDSVITYLSNGDKITTDKVIVACGRTPNAAEFGEVGLKIEDKKIVVNDKMQTTIPDIYAAGDVVGPPLLAHKASAEAIVAIENACGKLESLMDYSAVPYCIFSHPEIAWVGKFESEIPEAKIGEYRFQGVGKSLCIEETTGFVKVVADKDGKIKGMQIVGHNAADLILIGIIGVKKGMSVEELGHLIFPHPTLSECLKEALSDVTHTAIHKV